jgi:hypothetical protein
MMKILAVASLLAANTAVAQVKDEYDRFEGSRKLTYESQADIALGKPQASIHAVVKDGVETIFLRFIVTSASDRRTGSAWKYLRCNDIDWLVDGKPVPLGRVDHSGQVVRGGVIEVLLQAVTREQLLEIGSGDFVEYRICQDEYRLNQFDLTAMRSIYRKLSGQEQATPAPKAEPKPQAAATNGPKPFDPSRW